MIFVDTGAWFACFVRDDPHFARASAWYLANTERLVTTNLVVVELLTLLKARHKFPVALTIGDGLLSGELAVVEEISSTDLAHGWQVYKTYRDKAWSFTDCVSRVVLERLGITRAFAFDEHFRQFGSVTVVP